MRKSAKAVIGAGYGDEGKGATVDRLTRGAETLVARFNGGAQAGHTVVAADGRRHVFHHVGSGALRGAATFLSRFFVSNPVLLSQELAELAALGVRPTIKADGRGLLTTPYDMLINQAVEIARGGRRHGSCGYGFGETIERAERGFGVTVADAIAARGLRNRLVAIRDQWVPLRLAELGVERIPADYAAFFESDDMIEAFLAALAEFAVAVDIGSDAPLRAASDVIFEGAQGLALDQQRGAFPYVTRSNTGLKNILALCAETGVEAVEAIYATRCYVTRHGAGPLPGELDAKPFAGIEDKTNMPNPWQGALRFAWLDLNRLAADVSADLSDAQGSGVRIAPSFAVNCLDQAPEYLPIFLHGRPVEIPRGGLLDRLNALAGFGGGMEGWGPGAADFARRAAPDKAA